VNAKRICIQQRYAGFSLAQRNKEQALGL